MTKQEEKTAMFAAVMEITNITHKIKKFSPAETELLQKNLLAWMMGIKLDGGVKNERQKN